MDKIKEAIEHLKVNNKFLKSENDIYSESCIELNNVAIQALEEKQERREKLEDCDYCHMEWGTRDEHTNRFCYEGEISYCPMCGRKLGEQNEID